MKKLLLFLTGFLIIFIPVWPKIPLFQPIPGYIVRVRVEDVIIGVTGIIWLIALARKKISYKTPLNIFIGAYLLIGLLSLLSALFLIKTIPILPVHIAKAFLHLLRYTEYFSLFFFTYSAIQKKGHAQFLISCFLVAVIATTLYGAGQKYFRWPVYSTMNWEFSSGIPLELASPYARVQSTFAGHYDFAIFMVLILPLITVLLFTASRRKHQVILTVIYCMALWSLIVSGLRSAFLSYLLATGLVILLFLWRERKLQSKFKLLALRIAFVSVLTTIFFVSFGSNLSALLEHAVGGVFFSGNSQNVTQPIISQYVLPVPRDEADRLPSETLPAQPQQLSGCAKEKEISLCIRLESLWPQAIKGFLRQPFLGSGFSTLNKRDFNHLAEADGVDNNYLRILGETGVLGFVAFFAIIGRAVLIAKKKIHDSFSIAYLGIISGLLANAVLIDVFAASKVAFSFWALTGTLLGYLHIHQKESS